MSATDEKTAIRLPIEVLREAAAVGIRATERSLSALLREADRWLPQAQLRLRAWREALDPTTASWIDKARKSGPVESPEETKRDLQRRIEAARSRL